MHAIREHRRVEPESNKRGGMGGGERNLIDVVLFVLFWDRGKMQCELLPVQVCVSIFKEILGLI